MKKEQIKKVLLLTTGIALILISGVALGIISSMVMAGALATHSHEVNFQPAIGSLTHLYRTIDNYYPLSMVEIYAVFVLPGTLIGAYLLKLSEKK